ncbi:MAG: SusC/RagA family TonB-linked outer membrane protein [Bacteroidota bacterium]
MKQILLLLLCCSLTSWLVAQQTVSGQVTDPGGSALIGVSVVEVGTSNGTVSDLNGNYSITVQDGASLQFSYTGYETTSVEIGNQSTINIALSEGVALDEVVVTALGISREKKNITYAAQNVATEELSQARELNVVNSLAGKVAGLTVSQSGAGVGSASRVILRGNRSIAGSSQPLYIVDGVPILGDISDINPDDIASISVLKGPNAAALYGNRANNGAIVIETKRGTAGDVKVSLSTTLMANQPIILTNYQNQFAQGNNGAYATNSEQTWGPALSGQSADHWSNNPDFPTSSYALNAGNNVEDFFQTGFNSATNIALSGGTSRAQTYFSYTYTDAAGIVPNNELARHNINARITNNFGTRWTLDAKVNYIREDIDNELSQGESFDNPIRHALRLPPNIRTEDAEIFEFVDAEGNNRQHYWNPGSNGGANPYWTINRNTNQRDLDRVIGLISLKYQIADGLSLMARSTLDKINRQWENRWWNDSYIIADNGRYTATRVEETEFNADLLLNYSKDFSENFYINVIAGANARKERGSFLQGTTGDNLTVPNFFAIANSQDNRAFGNFGAPRDVNSVYGSASLTFLNAITLDITARNDWSSTLPKENWSFFYPSFGLSAVVSDLVDLPNFWSFAKLRANWAQVGNDTDPFRTLRNASVSAGGNNGFLQISTTIPNENLLPEETVSIDLGADLRFFDSRLGLDIAYYRTNSRDQLFAVALPVGSGASQFFTNGGDIQNEGIEAVLTLSPVRTSDFSWNILFNFTQNESTVLEINDERPSIQIASDFLRAYRIEEGRPFGEVFSRGFERDAQGRILVGDDGLPVVTSGLTTLVANFNPDWLGGFRNEFNYKGLNFSFLIDIRQGGSVASLTNAILYGDGLTEETLAGREGNAIFGQGEFSEWGEAVKEDGSPNDIPISSEAFWRKVGGRNAPVGEVFARDASNVRLRELVLGYRFPFASGPVSALRVSVVGRNLFFFSNAAGDFDPEVLVGTGKAGEGFQSFGPPTTRSFGLSLGLDF